MAVRQLHYPRDRLVLRVSRITLSRLVYAYCRFFVYTCLQSTYPRPTKRPYESLRVALRLKTSLSIESP